MKKIYLFAIRALFLPLLLNVCAAPDSLSLSQDKKTEAPTAATYTWNVASGAWTSSGSWTPARTTPAVDDILIFDGATQAAPTVTGIPAQTIGQLKVINNANVTFSSGTATAGTGTISRAATAVTGVGTAFTTQLAVGDLIYGNTTLTVYDVTAIASDTALTTSQSGTVASQNFSIAPKITISGGAGSLLVNAGSTLTVNTAALPPVSIFVATGSTGTISGNVTFQGGNERLNAADANAINFASGSIFTAGTGSSGNAFTPGGTANALVFASGSTFIQAAGSNPFALTAPASKVVFQTGSLFSVQANLTPSFSGRTYANVEVNSAVAVLTVTGGSAVTMDNLTVTQGTLNFNMTATPGHSIKGNIAVAGTLNFAPASAGTVNLNGTSTQTISGAGTITSTNLSTININNATGVTLSRSLTIGNATAGGGISFTTGRISTGANTLTIASGASITGAGSGSYVNGNLQKTVAIAAGAGSQRWEVGDASLYAPIDFATTTGASAITLTGSTTAGDHPSIATSGLNATKTANRYWTLTTNSGSFGTANLTFNFNNPADLDGTANTANFVVKKFDAPSTWASTTTGTVTSTSTQATGVSGFSDFQVGELAGTAANVSLSGRIMTADGRGVRNAIVSVSGGNLTQPMFAQTGSFGYYSFSGLESGQAYIVSVASKRYAFANPSRVISLSDNIADFDFIADP